MQFRASASKSLSPFRNAEARGSKSPLLHQLNQRLIRHLQNPRATGSGTLFSATIFCKPLPLIVARAPRAGEMPNQTSEVGQFERWNARPDRDSPARCPCHNQTHHPEHAARFVMQNQTSYIMSRLVHPFALSLRRNRCVVPTCCFSPSPPP